MSSVLLARDANYPWLILVPRVCGAQELIDLPETARGALSGEIDAAARALKAVSGCDKLNVAALGNVVRQLHVHVIARFQTDPAWPGPVWGRVPAIAYADGAGEDLARRLAGAIAAETA